MQILYIIGNGFDLNLGLKTNYRSFFEYYKSQESPNQNVQDLKRDISENYNNWSDLELALGHYTSQLESVDDFDDIFEDIGEKLANYLRIEERKFKDNDIDSDKFFQYLVRPEDELRQVDKNKITEYKKKYFNHHWAIDIFTFNYTTIIEKVIGENQRNISIGNHPNQDIKARVTLRGVEHIHGYTNNRMVLGVNDKSQIKNKSFHDEPDIQEALIKSDCNATYGHTIDDQFKAKIKSATFICIFGSSIGDTDNMWWELIGQRLKDDIPVVIFSKGEEVISPRIGYKTNRTRRKVRNYFLEKTNLPDDAKNRIKDNIFIGLDTGMFNDIIHNRPVANNGSSQKTGKPEKVQF